ncbi:hypothetical protein [Silvimonas soli]|uniref:hypothetical protein n=1 Tax=Silvimonas soli TaxID=2980100 RepID=UPI0024B37305|nr:hypothetical protein [Silvimonas soli]
MNNFVRTILRHGLFPAFLLAYAAFIIVKGPLATNDGPVHLSFAYLLSHYGSPEWPLQSQMFVLANTLQPNMAVYAILRTLLLVFSPDLAEACLQALCLITPALAARYALRQINPANTWLAWFVLPLTANRLFYLGLYNFLFSVAGFFLVIGLYVRLRTKPSLPLAVALGCALVVTLLSHAAGFLMALLAIGVLSGLQFFADLRAGQSWRQLGATYGRLIVGLCIPLPLVIWFFLQQHGAQTLYGIPLHERVDSLMRAKLFRIQTGDERVVSCTLVFLQVATAVGLMVGLWRKRAVRWRLKLAWFAALTVFILFFAFSLLVPDISGGGWSHFMRAALFPLLWAVLCAAFFAFRRWQRVGLSLLALALLLIQFHATNKLQASLQPPMNALQEIDHLIGAHCTVLPVLESSVSYDQNGVRYPWNYDPLFQATNRLELSQDRVVLFNFLARLKVYPVHFRPGYDTQDLIFHWQPGQPQVAIQRLDVPRFEQQTGLPVDYVVIWGKPTDTDAVAPQDLARALNNATLIYESPDKLTRLYQRVSQKQGMCSSAPRHAQFAMHLATP